jgi:hypothetical protein
MSEPLSKTEKADFDKSVSERFAQMQQLAAASQPTPLQQPPSQQVALGNTSSNVSNSDSTRESSIR